MSLDITRDEAYCIMAMASGGVVSAKLHHAMTEEQRARLWRAMNGLNAYLQDNAHVRNEAATEGVLQCLEKLGAFIHGVAT